MPRLGDIGVIITGNTPKTNDKNNYSSNDICFVKPSDIEEDRVTYLYDSEYYISEYAKDKARILPPESILVTCIGIIGKVGINAVECAFNQQINAIIPDTAKCNTRYLANIIQYKRTELQNIANAPVVPIINKSQFSGIEIFLPSLQEQQKVVKILDRIDNLLVRKQQQLHQLEQLIKSRFIELFEGEIESSQAELGHISRMISGGTPSSKHPEYFGGDIPFISTPSLGANYIDETVAQNWLTQLGVDNSSTHVIPEQSLMVGIRVGIGKCSINKCPMCTNQDIISFVDIDSEKYDLLFIKKVIEYHANFFDFQKRGATIKGITSDIIKAVKIPMVSIDMQKQFAGFVHQVDKSKLAIQKSLEKLEILKKSLTQQYFG